MALEPSSIPRIVNLPPSKDFVFLRETGIDIAQELAGEIWTDYNLHDPGITILEQFCLAITELAYKSGMSIEDILYAERPDAFDSQDNAFFTPERVFPCSPQTVMDYRRVLVDQMYPKVKNAWLEPLESGAFGVNMHGLYRVSLIFDEAAHQDLVRAKDEVYRELNRYRNLGEDFEIIRALKPLRLSVRGHLKVDPAFLVEDVLARVLHQLAITVTPPVRFRTRKEYEDDGHSVEHIFEGPLPKHGFVDTESLKNSGLSPNWVVIPSARLNSIIRDIEGVESINNLEVGVYIDNFKLPIGFKLIEKFKGEEEHDGFYLTTVVEKLSRGHRIKDVRKPRRDLPEDFYLLREEESLPEGFYPRLDIDSVLNQHLFTCSVEGLEYDYNVDNVRKTLERYSAEELAQYQHPIVYPPHKPKSRRTAKELAYYFSIQNHFPEIYGIGHFGVSKSRPAEWRTHARNLKAYLYFFEQIMADYLSQLTEFFRLFSLKDDVESTYFHQVPTIPNQDMVLKEGQTLEDLKAVVDQIGKKFDPVGDRRNRALDHLLARFGEEFLSESYSALTRNTIEENQVRYEEEIILAKIKFLQDIVALTRDRGRGQDYLGFGGGRAAQDAVMHSNALSKRLSLIFNMKDYMQMSLSESVRSADGVSFVKGKARAKAEKGKAAFTFTAAQQDILATVLQDGLSRDNFAISENTGKGGGYQVFFAPTAGFGGGNELLVA